MRKGAAAGLIAVDEDIVTEGTNLGFGFRLKQTLGVRVTNTHK